MKKTEKQTYFSPKIDIIEIAVWDIMTTSNGLPNDKSIGQGGREKEMTINKNNKKIILLICAVAAVVILSVIAYVFFSGSSGLSKTDSVRNTTESETELDITEDAKQQDGNTDNVPSAPRDQQNTPDKAREPVQNPEGEKPREEMSPEQEKQQESGGSDSSELPVDLL